MSFGNFCGDICVALVAFLVVGIEYPGHYVVGGLGCLPGYGILYSLSVAAVKLNGFEGCEREDIVVAAVKSVFVIRSSFLGKYGRINLLYAYFEYIYRSVSFLIFSAERHV